MSLNDSAGNTDSCVFVAFHVPSDMTYDTTVLKIEKTINNLFGDEQNFEFSSRRSENDADDPIAVDNSYEILYRIQKPLTLGGVSFQEFFDKLNTLFSLTDNMTPHFTQISGS